KIMGKNLHGDVIRGKKKGFSVPLNKWFKEDFSELIKRHLSRERIEKRGYFNYDTVSTLIGEHLKGVSDNSKHLWTLICFEIWHQKYLD
ncbi:asparagine synthase-related protein, partial [Candidatus Omnitrophota bacterium]